MKLDRQSTWVFLGILALVCYALLGFEATIFDWFNTAWWAGW